MIAKDPIQGKRFAELVGCRYKQHSIFAKDKLSYCQTHFCGSSLPELKTPFLITHNSDKTVTGHDLQHAPPILKRWFSCNCEASDRRAVALPLGLLNSQDALELLRATPIPSTRKLLYLNAPANGNRHHKIAERTTLYQMFGNSTFCTVRSRHNEAELPRADYFREMAEHAYTFSPTGAGPDCHRIWEALYLGTFPICKKEPALLPFQTLPILFVDSWQEVTVGRLRFELPGLEKKSQEAQRFLKFRYWKEMIKRCTR